MVVSLTPQFKRKFKKLDPQLQKEAILRIKQFEQDPQNPELHTHPLKGKLKGVYSFSVNYKIRILFQHLSKQEVALLSIGSHDIYK
jgi:addiction module RelE/StbE family toxin